MFLAVWGINRLHTSLTLQELKAILTEEHLWDDGGLLCIPWAANDQDSCSKTNGKSKMSEQGFPHGC